MRARRASYLRGTVMPSSTACFIVYRSTTGPKTCTVSSMGVPVKPTNVAFGSASCRYWAKPNLTNAPAFSSLVPSLISSFSPRLSWVRWASSLKQIMLLLLESNPVFSQNFCTVVTKIPPDCLARSSAFRSSRLSKERMASSPKKSVEDSNNFPDWVSRSSRSTMTRIVGERDVRFMSRRARKSIV